MKGRGFFSVNRDRLIGRCLAFVLSCAAVCGCSSALCAGGDDSLLNERELSGHDWSADNNYSALFDGSRFLIGSCCAASADFNEEMVLAMKDAGLDFFRDIPSPTPERYALCAKHGLPVFASPVPRVVAQWGTGQVKANLLARYDAKAAEYKAKFGANPKPVVCLNLGDEPFVRDLPEMQRAVWRARQLFPDMGCCLNLDPLYAMKEAFGKGNYEDYVDAYCRLIPIDHISYDFYLYAPINSENPDLVRMDCINKIIVANACRKTGRSFWYYAQVNSYPGQDFVSENRLRYQALSGMAFGMEVLQWACWQDGSGWWSNNVYTAKGERTEQFGKLKRVNAELHRLGTHYMYFRNVNTHLVGFKGRSELLPTRQVRIRPPESPDELNVDSVSRLRADDGSPLMVGEMVARRRNFGARALFVFSADDPWDKIGGTRQVLFETQSAVRAFGMDGEIAVKDEGNGVRSVPIASNRAVLIVIGCKAEEDDGFPFRVVCRHRVGKDAEGPLSTGYFLNVQAEDGNVIEVDEMVPRYSMTGSRALRIAAPASVEALGGKFGVKRRIVFQSGGVVREMGTTRHLDREKDGEGRYSLVLNPGESATVVECSNLR